MALRDILDSISKRFDVTSRRLTEKVPFVHLFGHEKTYGAPQPQDFSRFIASYKSWAYACAWKNAISVAKTDINLYKRKIVNNSEELDLITEHPFIEVLNAVNPFSNKFELLTITELNLELTGNAYWWMPKSELRVPYMIWNIPSHWVKIVPSKEKFVEGYVVQVPNSGKLIPFDEEEIIHFRFPSPFDIFYGTGPLFAAAYGLDLNEQIKTWGINFFMNNAQPSGVLMTDGSLNSEQYQRLRDRWNEKYRGSQNSGKIAILEAGLKYQQTGSNLQDAKFDNVSRETRDEILAIFGVPASKLGLVQDVNRANADANDYTYQKETIFPRLKMIEEKINEKIIPMYDPKLVVKFDNPVPEDNEFILKQKESNIRTGITSIDEERIKEGLDPLNLPETSVPLIPFNMVPAGQPKTDSGSIPQEQEEKSIKSLTKAQRDSKWHTFARVTAPQEKLLAGVIQRYFQSQQSEVMSRLNNFKSLKKGLFESIIFSLQQANKNLRERAKQNVKTAYVSGFDLGMKETGQDIDLQTFDPNIERAVAQRLEFFADKVNRSTTNLLKKEINSGIGNGESIDKIAQRVDKVFQFSGDFRSKRIAQTEVIGAANDGTLASYKEAGVTKKEWLTARDEVVRDSHHIDGQVVESEESFTTGIGSKLQYPGDRSSGAPAEDIINCRCTVLPVLK